MKVTLAIKPHQDNTDICFGKLQINHVECENGMVLIQRNPAAEEYSLRCNKCSIQINIATNGTGYSKLLETAIDEKSRSLEKSDFQGDSVYKIQVTTQES